MFRRLALISTAVLTLAAATPATTATTTVQITKLGFVPQNITVTQGDQVTWQNADTANHQVVSQQGGWASPVLAPTQTWTRTFDQVGKFQYVDSSAKNIKGTVTVKAPPASVSLAASTAVVTYSGRTTLSGTVSSKQTGERVDLYKLECSKTPQTMTKMDTATTTTGGAYSMSVQPLENTSYQARWTTASSPVVAVKAKPRLRLGKVAPRRFSIRTFADISFAGHVVVVQRWVPSLHAWKGVRTATLRANTSGVAPTVVSSVTFTLKVAARTKLRVVITQKQVGACYLPGTSNAILA